MSSAATNPAPSPQLILNTMNAFQRSEALKTAIELDVFTAVGSGATTAAGLASKINASERGLRILCDFLTVCGLLTKEGNQYGLTPDTATFLDKRSPAYLGGSVRFFASSEIRRGFEDLTAAVRNGGSSRGTIPDWPVWVEFARSMAPLRAMSAKLLAERFAGFLHHFDKPANEGLLRKVHAALAPGGKALALEFVPNEDRVSPPMDASFSLVMLAATPNGDAYTFPEYQQMFRNAGFARSELQSLPLEAGRVVVATRD